MNRDKLLQLIAKLLVCDLHDSEELKKFFDEFLALQGTDAGDHHSEECTKEVVGFLKFSNKEISKMKNKDFSKVFIKNGRVAHYRKRIRGKNSCSYEIRFRRNGYNISVSSTDLNVAKLRFIEAVTRSDYEPQASSVPTAFDKFAEYYIENYWKRKVTAKTYKTEFGRYNRHIKPYFGSTPIRKITPLDCQKLLDSIVEEGHGKTADEVRSMLNGIFVHAVKHSLITNNPIELTVYTLHVKKTGNIFTKDEERRLLEFFAGTEFELMFAVILYTGLRPNEYKSARIEGDFIISINSKRKNGKIEYKKIPITPMLRLYLVNVDKLYFYRPNCLRDNLHKVFPEHTLKDLRKTFNTRCIECGISDVARMEFMGHSLGQLLSTYTQLSDEYLIEEGNKFKY
jgi:integrase